MALVVPSLVTSSNASNAASAITTSSYNTGGISTSAFDGAGTTSSSLTGIVSPTTSTSQAINATNTTASSSSSISSTVSSLLSSASTSVSSALSSVESSVSKLLGSSNTGIADAYSGSTASVFGDSSSSNTAAGAVKTATPDPIKSSFASGTPVSPLFKTTSATTGLAPVTITGQKASTTDKTLTSTTDMLGQKYGNGIVGTTASSISSALNTITKSSITQGLYSGIGSVESTVTSTVSSVSSVTSSLYQGSLADWRSLTGGLARDLTGNSLGMDGLLNSDLPSTADLNGNAISGVPTDMSTSSITSLYTTAKSLGCQVSDINYTSYGAEQSLYGGLLGITAQTNMTSLLSNLVNCDRFNGYGIDVGKQLFYSTAGTNVNSASTLLSGLGASNVASTSSLSKTIVTNSSLTSSDTGTVSSMLSTLGYSDSDPFTTGTSVDGTTVWDTDTLSSATTATSTGLLTGDNSDLPLIVEGTEYDLTTV